MKNVIVNENDKGKRLDIYIAENFNELSRTMIKKLIETKWTGVVLAGAGILMIIFGIYRGEMSVVFTKAVNICMECIGIG